MAFLFTALMIAIAFSIPISMYMLFSSTQNLSSQWDDDKQITLFLHNDVNTNNAKKLADDVASYNSIENTIFIDKKTALVEFKNQTGLSAITDTLAENPLPHLIIANPKSDIMDFDKLQILENTLTSLDQVEHVQFDLLWFQRLQAILDVINRIIWIVTTILVIAIGLIIANVIRWEVSSRHSEIEIIKLIGASDSYVRRPFLYTGFWLGLSGAVFAYIAVSICGWLVQQSSQTLASLFDSEFQIVTLSLGLVFLLFVCASVLGVGSAWIAVSHKLKRYC